jgi:hypothetical protein
LLDRIADVSDDEQPLREQIDIELSSRIYKQNLPNLGNLSGLEVQYTIEYYNSIENVIQYHEKYNGLYELKYSDERELSERDDLMSGGDQLLLYRKAMGNSAKEATKAKRNLLTELDKRTSRFWWAPRWLPI